MVLDWFLLGLIWVLMPLSVLWSVATPKRRARTKAGSYIHPAWMIVAFAPVGLLVALDIRGAHLRPLWVVAMLPIILLGQRHRRRLQGMPDEALSPAMRSFRDQPEGSLFNPLLIWPRLKHSWTHMWSRSAREEQRAWERARGLR